MEKSVLARWKINPRNLLWIAAAVLWSAFAGQMTAQTNTPRDVYITQVDTERYPQVTVRAYGRTAGGAPLDFGQTAVEIVHGEQLIEDVSVVGREAVGTFTVFLLDTPAGINDQLPQMAEAIQAYTTADYMEEQMDYVAIYQVGETGAEPLLAPTSFYNAVRNFLVDPLPVSSGPTALINSLDTILAEMPTLKPDPAMAAHIVVMSDGTDVVSSTPGEAVTAAAVEQSVSIHTVTVPNAALRDPSAGRAYLQQLAAVSGGVAAELDQDLTPIRQRIAALRDHTLLRYTAAEPTAGTTPLILSLREFPAVQAGANITIDAARPIITLPIPPEAQSLTLGDLSSPVTLSFPTEVRRLDDTTPDLTQLQLWVNDQLTADIPPENAARFEAAVDNLIYGQNRVWVTAADETGRRVSSPIVTLQIEQGETAVPDILTPGTSIGGWMWLLGCLAGLLLLAGIGWWAYTQGGWKQLLPKAGRRGRVRARRAQPQTGTDETASTPHNTRTFTTVRRADMDLPAGCALDIIDAQSAIASPIGLRTDSITIGRSPSVSDIAFTQDDTMSRLHATLLREDEHAYRIFDEASTSGTWVNQQPVPDYGIRLMDGDEIHLGAVRLRFRLVYDS